MRVYELADELGIPSAQVLAVLQELDETAPRAAAANVPDELVDRVREAVVRERDGGEEEQPFRPFGRDLIRRAFETARLSGKPEWDSMTVAVLKNRVLDLTDRLFDESAYGVASFQEWVRLFPELVSVDRSRKPAVVRFHGTTERLEPETVSRPETPPRPPGRWRIRSDLWRAVLDRGGVGSWIWDGQSARYEPDAVQDSGGGTVLPTLSASELRELRASFAASQGPDANSDQLDRWAEDFLPDSVLRYPVRGYWFAYLKQSVLERLRAWFGEHGLDEPSDLVETADVPTAPEDDPLRELRSLVIRCVQGMTRAELEELRLPPAALLRVRTR